MKGKVLFVVILCLTLTYAFRKTCHALALEGGGDKGAYQVGAMHGLVTALKKHHSVSWDVVTGVSIGAINGAGLSLHDIGDEETATTWLMSLWKSLSASDIYQSWTGGIA